MKKKHVISVIDPRSSVAESFRIIRANLQFAAVDQSFKTMLITSAGPLEGKSETVANLGTVIAQAGFKVVIVDCDLRCAEQHELFGLPNNPGLTNVLIGSMDIAQVLRDTTIPNLRVVTSGPQPPNPSELLQSDKAKKAFGKLNQIADILLIDSPPVLVRADATVLSSMADGVIVVVKAARTKTDAVLQAKERLEKASAKIIGTVLNGVR